MDVRMDNIMDERQEDLRYVRNKRRARVFLVGVEILFVLLGLGFVLVGNGLIFAIAPLFLVVSGRASARQFFNLHVVTTYVVLVSLHIGLGTWLLIESGFSGQNLIIRLIDLFG
jgi:hypothetical protein